MLSHSELPYQLSVLVFPELRIHVSAEAEKFSFRAAGKLWSNIFLLMNMRYDIFAELWHHHIIVLNEDNSCKEHNINRGCGRIHNLSHNSESTHSDNGIYRKIKFYNVLLFFLKILLYHYCWFWSNHGNGAVHDAHQASALTRHGSKLSILL